MASTDWLNPENQAILSRRQKCDVDTQDTQRWGLALSGGGIRSATFCLGVIKSLAKNGLLTRFDYLSTVSGGGYAGVALGRLFQAVDDPAQVQTKLAQDDRLIWWWLRKNGRYLLPAGVKDAIFAGSTLLRNLAAVYFDLLLIGILVSCLIVLPHLIGMQLGREFREWTAWSPSAWWLFAATLPGLFLVSSWAYWFSAPEGRWRIYPVSIVFGAVGLLVSVLLLSPGLTHQLFVSENPSALSCNQVIRDANPAIYAAWAFGCLSSTSRFVLLQLSLALPLAVVVAWLAGAGATSDRASDPARARNRLTRGLTYVVNFTLVIVVAAIIDRLSWWIAGTVIQGWAAFAASGGGLLLLVAGGRALLLWLKDLRPSGAKLNVARLANIAGLLLAFLFLLFCATVVQVIVFYGGGFTTGAPPVNEPEIWATQSAARLVLLALPCVIYIIFTGRNLVSLNASSLHNFYRARLTRSYVSVGNAARGFQPSALAPTTPEAVDALTRVSDVVPHDDVPLAEYRPHAHGGPLHLINVCVNQTVNDCTGEFNRDRKGRNLSVSSVGCDLGSPPQHLNIDYRDGAGPSLAQWIAISGAAAAPGMGSHTSKGLAALLTLCGVRLGYWLDIARTNGKRLKDATFLHKLLPKYGNLLDEILAIFPGSNDPHWYVSDGGHFENTGVYALLKREVELIVAVDCGADHNYSFNDLNNLVRLARIDFNAEIIFQQPEREIPTPSDLDISSFGTLAEIAAADNSSFLMMARIEYASGKIGHLLIIKPTIIGTLPLDLMNYKSGNPTFPQQTTADQFFDEAQWESYFCLGEELGSTVSGKLLGSLPALSKCFKDQLGTGIAASGANRALVVRRAQPKFAGEIVKSSLGVGAVAGLLFSIWQVWDQQRATAIGEQRQYAEAINKAIEKSVDSAGNLRISDAGILLLEGIIKPEEPLRTDLDLSLAKNLISRLNALCIKEPGDGAAHSAQCQQLAALVLPFTPQGGDLLTAYWPGAPKDQSTSTREVAQGQVATASSPVLESAAQPNSSIVALPTTAAPSGASIDLNAKADNKTSQLESNVIRENDQDPTGIDGLPAPMPPPSATPVTEAKAACMRPEGAKVRLYILVYAASEFTAFSLAKKQPPASDLKGTIVFALIENVETAAKKSGARLPYRWTVPTVLYHNESERACAEKLAGVYENAYGLKPNIRSLPERLKKQAGAIELWVPVGGAPKLTDRLPR